ncbi:hypothetical protein CspeluHIS016_0303260 [Cutaneotrichosporon spelunceum]|uniref:Uncharacterized protein n=1 Tax=Cutaneotrichosporon spelunceum TaxID=1672016 RepID=A0AAD3TT94_9TREE|nr:hypothetical protein CspeluHIS016_0303260 [Cutaneotrichosporon spelunceum]
MPLTIDHDSFPNIIDTIIRLGPHDTLVVLRDTCRDIKSKIGILLPRHLQLVIRDDLPPDDPECLRWRVWGTRIDVGEGRTLNARNPSNLTVLAWGLVEEFPDRPIRFVGAEEWDDNWLRRKVPRQYFESELDTIDFALRLVNDSALDVGADYLNIEEDCGPDATVADRFKWWINAMADVYHSTDERMRMRIRQNVAFMTMDEFKAKQHGDEMAALMTSQYRSRG